MQAPATFHNDFRVPERLKLISTATMPELNQADAVIQPIPLWQETQRSYHQAVEQRRLKLAKPGIFARL